MEQSSRKNLTEGVVWKKLLLFAASFIGVKKLKWHPVAFIAISAVIGVDFSF